MISDAVCGCGQAAEFNIGGRLQFMEGKNQASYVQKDGVIKPPTGQEGEAGRKEGQGR